MKLPMTILRHGYPAALVITALAAPMIAQAAGQSTDAGMADPETLAKAYTGKSYSPYAGRAFPERPLWGDSHVHTSPHD
jgi:hypothetical protein